MHNNMKSQLVYFFLLLHVVETWQSAVNISNFGSLVWAKASLLHFFSLDKKLSPSSHSLRIITRASMLGASELGKRLAEKRQLSSRLFHSFRSCQASTRKAE